MTTRLRLKRSGLDPRGLSRRALRLAGRAWSSAARETGPELKLRLRRQAQRGFPKSTKLPNMWGGKFHPNPGDGPLAARFKVFPRGKRSRAIIEGLATGSTKRPKRARTLAWPTPPVKKMRRDRFRVTPGNWPEHRFGPLQKIRGRGGNDVLIAPDATERGGRVRPLRRTRVNSKSARASRRVALRSKDRPLVAFILAKSARGLKVFEPVRARNRSRRRAAQRFTENLTTLQRAGGLGRG